jgi:hypothetical protein
MFRTSWLALSVLLGAVCMARSEDAPQAAAHKSDSAAVVVQPQDPIGKRADADKPTADETWRYRKHNGKWWYWLPSNRWVVWNGREWAVHKSPQQVASGDSNVRRSFSHSPSNQSSRWGSRRYDRFGNVLYPYSRRHSGLKQLGAVPAPGGVRAMPGWGGER